MDNLLHRINKIKNDPHAKYNGNEIDYLLECMDSEDLRSKENPFVQRLEEKFCDVFGVKYAIAHNSGTSTLHTCLAAAGVGFGDEVISPAHTVIMNATTTLHQNAIPVFADIDPDTFNIDPTDIERKITSKTKAIFVVHMHGLPADMDPIMAIAKKHDLIVIEDSAQCVLGYYKGRLCGTIGDMSSFSFETKKHLSIGEGGMVLTNSKSFGTLVRRTAGNGYKVLEAGEGLRQLLPEEFQNPHYKRHNTLAWNYRMNEVSAAVGLAQMERVELLVQKRQEVARYYLEALEGCNWIIPQKVPEGCENTYWTFTCKYLGEDAHGIKWEDFYRLFKNNGGDGFYGGLSVVYQELLFAEGILMGSNYLPSEPPFKESFRYEKGICPNAERIQPQMMQFKTNYRNLNIAQEQSEILKRTIIQIENSK
ncbi:MAG: histidine kinase [Chloroflexi bacterium]|nr:histidine kinase [Chloroflexota bacterium]|tara:strand:- start:1926 stop:3191 length:1266 start_codon:yes stop_codon:yes gene_type:complete